MITRATTTHLSLQQQTTITISIKEHKRVSSETVDVGLTLNPFSFEFARLSCFKLFVLDLRLKYLGILLFMHALFANKAIAANLWVKKANTQYIAFVCQRKPQVSFVSNYVRIHAPKR